jgi:hypothetical protein
MKRLHLIPEGFHLPHISMPHLHMPRGFLRRSTLFEINSFELWILLGAAIVMVAVSLLAIWLGPPSPYEATYFPY